VAFIAHEQEKEKQRRVSMAFVSDRDFRVRKDYRYGAHTGLAMDAPEDLVAVIEDMRDANADLKEELREATEKIAELSFTRYEQYSDVPQGADPRALYDIQRGAMSELQSRARQAEQDAALAGIRAEEAEARMARLITNSTRARELADQRLQLKRDEISNLRQQIARLQAPPSGSGTGSDSTDEQEGGGPSSGGGGGGGGFSSSLGGGSQQQQVDDLVLVFQRQRAAQLELENERRERDREQDAQMDLQEASNQLLLLETQLSDSNARLADMQ
jgi:hypothetical protein